MLHRLWALLIALTSGVVTAICAVIALAIGLFAPFGRLMRGVELTWSHLIMWFAGMRVEVEGLENIMYGQQVKLTFMPAISIQGYEEEQKDELLQKVRREMQEVHTQYEEMSRVQT